MDLRIQHIFDEYMKDDTSFREKDHPLGVIFGTTKYSKKEMRETWHRGIKYGIEIGLRKASLEGQRIELSQNTLNEKNKEFLEKFYQLAHEYNCAIQYHPEYGMMVIERKLNF
jgi:hypothetical protein